jgi:hypothetical protein
MNSDEISASFAVSRWRFRLNTLGGLFLFLATALVVIWQNSRLAVLWDLSYILENSYRISLGDIPYRDFPLAHAPLTFLIQAAIIKLTGRVFWHHAAYCAIAGGLSTVLTWSIIRTILRDTVTHARLLAFLLSLPLIPLGIYCIFPHPFYDPDCTLAILIGVFLLQKLDLKSSSCARGGLAGIALAMPLFAKQNTGLAYLAAAVGLLIAVILFEGVRQRPFRGYLLTLAGAILGLAAAILLIQFGAGFRNYWHWTIQYAARRRTPAWAEMLGIYTDKMVLLWLAFIALGVVCLWLTRRRSPLWRLLPAFLMATPFIWPAIYLLRESDSSERAERLLAVWPVMLIVSFLVAVATIRRRRGASMVMPFIIIAAINGAFMSQQLWGSTYAIWPLLVILLAMTLAEVAVLRFDDRRSLMVLPFTVVAVASLLVSGGSYVRSHERLNYASLDEGKLSRSTLPQLKGLSVRGNWIPGFEELVHYADRRIPPDELILLVPGEDPFYYATGRRPRFPVLVFDYTVNPYSPEEILQMTRERNIRWVIIKQCMQDEDKQLARDVGRLTDAVKHDFEQVKGPVNYDIYRRKDPDKKNSAGDDNNNPD